MGRQSADAPDPEPQHRLLHRQDNSVLAIVAPAMLVVYWAFSLLRGDVLGIVLGVLGLALALPMAVGWPWRVLIYDDEVEVRRLVRADRRVPRSDVTVVTTGKRGLGALLFFGPHRSMFPMNLCLLTERFFDWRLGTLLEKLEANGYAVTDDMKSLP